MNLILLVDFMLEKSECKKKPTKKYIKILQLVVKTLLVLAFYSEYKGNLGICYEAIQDAVQLEKVIKSLWPQFSSLTSGLSHLYTNEHKVKAELSKLITQEFNIVELEKLSIPEVKPFYPYKFQINHSPNTVPKK